MAGLYEITPRRRAALDAIRYAEGTWADGKEDGYGIMFGGGRFDWRQGHPNRVVRTPGYASAAAGAYQFMPDTWKEISGRLGLKDFSPASQDQAALGLIERRGALELLDQEGFSPRVVAKLAPEWASLPTLEGKSAYDQPVKKLGELQKLYEQRRALYEKDGVGTVAAAPAPAPATPSAAAPAAGIDLNADDKALHEAIMSNPVQALNLDKAMAPVAQIGQWARELFSDPGPSKVAAAPRRQKLADPLRILKSLGLTL